MMLPLLLALALGGPVLREEGFDVQRPSEVLATLIVSCERCAWGRRGREAAGLALSVDGAYSQHLLLVQGRGPAEYRVALGPREPGTHRLSVALDPETSAPGVRQVRVERVEFAAFPEGAGDHAALAHAPVLHGRPDTLARFTDVPLLLWYESEPTPRGRRIRYSVVFSHQDAGTPADELMATFGRVTDLEFVYGVELDPSGRILAEEFQGPGRKVAPFVGAREGRHPLLWVATDDNMVSDRGETKERFAPAPFGFVGAPREAVMNAHPWTYRVMIQELAREGRLVSRPWPGSKRIPDPRLYAYLEACGEVEDATLAFAVGIEGKGGKIRWRESDGGQPAFRIGRSGCFRAAAPLGSAAEAASIRALRFHAYGRGEGGEVRLTRVSRLFVLGRDGVPGPTLYSWSGEESLRPGQAPLTLTIEPTR